MSITTESPEFVSFFEGCEKIFASYCTDHGYNIIDKFGFEKGRKYIKVTKGGSVHCFVNKENGDVLKPASWAAPAKHARGNIFDSKNGLGAMGPYGPAYIR